MIKAVLYLTDETYKYEINDTISVKLKDGRLIENVKIIDLTLNYIQTETWFIKINDIENLWHEDK